MRTSLLDHALSTGLEGFASPDTNAETTPDSVMSSAHRLALDADADLTHAHQTVSDLTRLGNGLEGLMIEVAHLEQKDDVTSEELAVLRESAMAVRRQFLSEEERRVFDGVLEGRLEGSTEGLGDLLKNVGTKLGYAVGNLFDSLKRSFGGNKEMLSLIDRKLSDTLARLANLPDVTYERTLSKDDAVLFSLQGKVDAHAVLADLPKAVQAWYFQPMTDILDRIELLSAHLAETLNTTSEEQYNEVVEAKAGLYTVPLPSSAAQVDTVTGKYYVFDLYDIYQSYGTRSRSVYVARPNKGTQSVSTQYANASALGVSEAVMTSERARNAQPAKVTFTKAQLMEGVQQLKTVIKDLMAYMEQQSLIVQSYRNYVQSTNNYENFKKNSFVDKQVLARVGAQAGAILALFDMVCISFYPTAKDVDAMAAVLKAFVYSSDLSKG